MSFEDEWRDLMNVLIDATERGKVVWKHADRTAGYVATLEATELRLSSVDDDGESPFELDIYQDGKFIEGVSGREDRAFYSDSRELYRLVQRQISGASEVVRGIIDDLRSPF